MINLTINGLNVSVEEGSTLLEAAQFLGFPIPTLCYMEGLSSYGACRLCVVEIGEEPKNQISLIMYLSGRRGVESPNCLRTSYPGAENGPGALIGFLSAVKSNPGPGRKI